MGWYVEICVHPTIRLEHFLADEVFLLNLVEMRCQWKTYFKNKLNFYVLILLKYSKKRVQKKLINNEISFTCPGSHLIGWPKNCRAVTTMDPKTNKAGVSWLDVLNAELSIVIAFLLRNQRASLNIRTNSAIFYMKLNFLLRLFSPASYGVMYVSYCIYVQCSMTHTVFVL